MRRAPLLIRRLIGIYRYDGGLGHLAHELRGDSCPLRALTHRGWRVNPEWAAMVADLAVPIALTRLDRCSPPVRRAVRHGRPCVVADSRTGPVVLLGPADLDRIQGGVDRFVDELRRAAYRAGLSWTLGMHDSSPAVLGPASYGRTGTGGY